VTALHQADPDIDAGLAEIHRAELRMRIGKVKDARVAEAFEVVDARCVDGARELWQSTCQRSSA
jgi:hypothetical protein